MNTRNILVAIAAAAGALALGACGTESYTPAGSASADTPHEATRADIRASQGPGAEPESPPARP